MYNRCQAGLLPSSCVQRKRCASAAALLAHPALDLIVAADAWNETEHELRKRMVLLVERNVRDCSAVGEQCGAAVVPFVADRPEARLPNSLSDDVLQADTPPCGW